MRDARHTSGWRREQLRLPNAFPFDNRVDGVGGDILERLDLSARPANLDRFHLRGGTEAKMLTEVVLREVTSAAADLAELLDAGRVDGDARADRGAIALRAHELE